jgi:uncharacterized phage-associated protein
MKIGGVLMAEADLSKEEQLIAFFVARCSGKLGRTQIVKLLYMADYESRRYLGRPLSDLNYIWHYHGPFDSEIYSGITNLTNRAIIREEQIPLPSGKTAYRYYGGDQPVVYNFSSLELEILGHVCRTYSTLSLRELLDDIVYETEPMKKAQAEDARGQKLDFAMIDRAKEFEFGLSTETLWKRIQAVRSGRSVSHAEVMRSLSEPIHLAAG